MKLEKPVEISNSILKVAHRCLKEFDYKYREQWNAKGKNHALERGTAVHKFLEEYYTTGDWGKAEQALRRKYPDPEKHGEFFEIADLADGMMDHYVDYYGEEDIKVIGTEMKFKVPGTTDDWLLKGTVDMLFEQDGILHGRDHKTGRIPDSIVRLMDSQLFIYPILTEYNDIDIEIWDYNYLAAKLPRRPAELKSGGLSKAKNIRTTHTVYLDTLREYGEDPSDYTEILEFLETKPNTFFAREQVNRPTRISEQLYLEAGATVELLIALDNESTDEPNDPYWPRNMAGYNCQRCEYLQLCITDLHGGDRDQVINDQYEFRDDQYGYGGDSEEENIEGEDIIQF